MTDEPAAGPEPDYRMSLAGERTYLSYVRTSLAMLVAGVAVVGVLPDAGHLALRRVMGVVLVLSGLVVALAARARWRQIDVAMRAGGPLPTSQPALVLAVAVVIAGALALALVLVI